MVSFKKYMLWRYTAFVPLHMSSSKVMDCLSVLLHAKDIQHLTKIQSHQFLTPETEEFAFACKRFSQRPEYSPHDSRFSSYSTYVVSETVLWQYENTFICRRRHGDHTRSAGAPSRSDRAANSQQAFAQTASLGQPMQAFKRPAVNNSRGDNFEDQLHSVVDLEGENSEDDVYGQRKHAQHLEFLNNADQSRRQQQRPRKPRERREPLLS